MPGGRTARREVVEHLGAVSIVAVDSDRLVTLIDQYRHPLGRRVLEIPAGLLDVAGEDPVDTAARELVEEVGLAAARWDVLVDVAASAGFTDEVARVFLARDLTAVERPVAEGDEETDLEIRRVPLDDAVDMALAGDILSATSVAGLLAAQRVISGASTPRPADAPWPDRPTAFAKRRG